MLNEKSSACLRAISALSDHDLAVFSGRAGEEGKEKRDFASTKNFIGDRKNFLAVTYRLQKK